MNRKKITMLAGAALTVGLMAGTMAGAADLKEYTLAVPFPESGIRSFEILRSNYDLLETETNGSIINAPAEMTPDGVLSFVEGQVAAGADGIIIIPPSDSILPSVTQQCEEAGMYWGIAFRSISDPEIREMVEASPYYVGNCFEDEETAGYQAGVWMGEQGYKKIALMSLTKGDTTSDARELGLSRACEEFGMEIVGESRAHTQASDAAAATESFLAANPDLDAICYISSNAPGTHEAVVKTIQEAGREEVKLVTVDFPDDMTADFESGVQVYALGISCTTFDPYITTLKVINAIQGTPVNDDGSFTSNSVGMFPIQDAETSKEYKSITEDPEYKFFEGDALKQLFKWENPELSGEKLQEIMDGYKPL